MVIGSNDAEFGYPLTFFTIDYRQRDLIFEVLKKYSRAKNVNFVNFYLDLHFLGHLIYALDGQTQCDYFCVNLMKSVESYRRYSTFFLLLSRRYIFHLENDDYVVRQPQ